MTICQKTMMLTMVFSKFIKKMLWLLNLIFVLKGNNAIVRLILMIMTKEASLNTSKARNAREGSLLPTGKGVPAHKAKPTEIRTDNRLNTTRSATASKETPLNISKQQPLMYEKGTPIYIKSWRNSKRIALGTVLSTDPNMTVGGVKLGKEFFMVRVGLVSVRDEPLIRPYKNLEAIGEVGDNPIAWPSNCVEKSFPAL